MNLQKVPRETPAYRLKSQALKRLGVTPEQLASAPDVTSILKETRGGIKLAFKAMRFSNGELIQKFLTKYDSITERDREKVSIEAVALSAGLDVRHLWGEIMLAIREQSVNQVKMIAIAAHPKITKSRVKFAQTPGGFRDRDRLDEMLGAIRAPQGSTFINKFFAGGSKETEEPEAKEEVVDDLNFLFPDCEKMQERLHPIRNKLLEAGK